MSINNVTFSYQEIVAYTKLNQLSADATNTTDNIHPQYALTTAAGVTDNFFVLKAGDTMTGMLTVPKLIVSDGGTQNQMSLLVDGSTALIGNLESSTIFLGGTTGLALNLQGLTMSLIPQFDGGNSALALRNKIGDFWLALTGSDERNLWIGAAGGTPGYAEISYQEWTNGNFIISGANGSVKFKNSRLILNDPAFGDFYVYMSGGQLTWTSLA